MHGDVRKTPTTIVKPLPVPGYCTLFITQKNRFCKFPSQGETENCLYHQKTSTNVPCPLDPGHLVGVHLLKRHLKKCNSRPPEHRPAWYQENCNLIPGHDDSQIDLQDIPSDTFKSVIQLIEGIYEEILVKTNIKQHPVMQDRIDHGYKHKHAFQQSSLIGHLDARGLLESSDLFIEWGAGRAEFSRYVNRACLSNQQARHHFLLIDRDGVRLKEDYHMSVDYASADPSIKDVSSRIRREKIDIAHLKLDALLDMKHMSICSISKHLCGAATDLTLRCLAASSASHTGLVIALCCHHRCTYSALHALSRSWLNMKGIGAHEFAMLAKLSTWFTNGIRDDVDTTTSKTHWSGLTYETRCSIGWMAKRVIDQARVHALLGMGYRDVELNKYVEDTVTKECVALIATKQTVNV